MIDRAVIQELKDQLVVICLGPHHRLYFLIRLNWFSKMMFYKKVLSKSNAEVHCSPNNSGRTI